MDEISIDSIVLMIDLINQDSLMDSTKYLNSLNESLKHKREYIKSDNKSNYCWNAIYDMHVGLATFGSSLQGQFLKEINEGEELNVACREYNKRIDPQNYMKAKAPITKAQIELAKKFVIENGYEESFNRRLATIEDIKTNEILHKNDNNINTIKQISIFDNMPTPSGTGRFKRSELNSIDEIGIEKFMTDILPKCTSVELLFENKMESNLVNLTTSAENSKKIFKWDNPFGYTFNGNLAGKSQIKENVKKAGGKIDGVLRFSIQWNDSETKGIVDFDVHAVEPNGTHIYYSSSYRKDRGNGKTSMSGQLDVDMISPSNVGVENITWSDINKMMNGKFKFFNRNYNSAQNTGFKAEIEFDGNVFNYHYVGNAQGDIDVATVTFKNGKFEIEHHLPEIATSKQLWNLNTNEFHKVNLICLSPNYWNDNNVGNKYYLFMLDNCKNPNKVRGFHNEHLISDLLMHRKVLDVLGNSAMIDSCDNQIAGVGFNATIRDEVILKLQGTFKRIVNVKF